MPSYVHLTPPYSAYGHSTLLSWVFSSGRYSCHPSRTATRSGAFPLMSGRKSFGHPSFWHSNSWWMPLTNVGQLCVEAVVDTRTVAMVATTPETMGCFRTLNLPIPQGLLGLAAARETFIGG